MDTTKNFRDCFRSWKSMPSATIRQFVKLTYGLDPHRDELHEVGGERSWALIYAVRYGHLRNLGQERSNDPQLPSDGPLHEVDLVLDTFEAAEFAVAKGWDIPDEVREAFLKSTSHFAEPPITTGLTNGKLPISPAALAAEMTARGGAPTTEPPEPKLGIKEEPRLRAQEQAILDKLVALGYDPTALPRNEQGKPGVPATCKKALSDSSLFTRKTAFKKAWERLSMEDIKYLN